MKTITTSIEGISPLLINKFSDKSEIVETMTKTKVDYGTPREQATAGAYFDETTKLMWIPSTWTKGAITSVSSDYKLPKSRKSVKSVIGGSVLCLQEKLYFLEKYVIDDAEVDSRPVVIKGRGRIMRHRARLEKWSLKFDISIDDSILAVENVHEMLSDAGRRSGIGDFRPQKTGPFGRFMITQWTVL